MKKNEKKMQTSTEEHHRIRELFQELRGEHIREDLPPFETIWGATRPGAYSRKGESGSLQTFFGWKSGLVGTCALLGLIVLALYTLPPDDKNPELIHQARNIIEWEAPSAPLMAADYISNGGYWNTPTDCLYSYGVVGNRR